jgi:transposase
MPMTHRFSEEQITELKVAKKKNKNKNVDKRLEALILRAENVSREKVAEKTGFCKQHVTQLTAAYHKNGLAAIVQNHYKGNHRNMSFEEEKELLEEFEKKAESGQIVEVSDILRAYENKLGRSVEKDHGRIYRVLKRHDFRKVMPRSKHPKSATPEAIEASKKLTKLAGN